MTWLIFILGAICAGFIQGLTGFAFGLVAMSFWVWVLPAQFCAPLVVIASFSGHILASFAEPHRSSTFRYQIVLPYLLAGIIGLPLGIYLLDLIEQDLFRLGLGLFLCIWSPLMLLQPTFSRLKQLGYASDSIIGFFAGILGGIGGLSGALPSVWMMLKQLPKAEQRYISRHFNFALQIFTLIGYAYTGHLQSVSLPHTIILIISLAIPAILGTRLFYKISEQQFKKILLCLLFCSGTLLLLRSGLML